MHTNRAPQLYIDADGEPCARVPLAKRGQFATLFAEDLSRLEGGRIPLNWYINLNGGRTHGQVKVAIPGDNVRAVARLITGAGKGEQVFYKDGNRLNLRRDNLVMSHGGRATVDAAELLERQGAAASRAE